MKSFDPYNYTTWHGHVKERPDGERARCGGPGNKVLQCATCNEERAYWLAKEQEISDMMTIPFDDEDLDLHTDEFNPEVEWDDMPASLDAVALDGDFPGHPFRGNQYASAHESSGSAVRASMRAKHHEGKGDKAAAKKAHKAAYHSHMAALSEVNTPAAQSYHRTMAKFHRGRAGVPGKASKALDAADGQSLDDLRAAFASASGAVAKLAAARAITAARDSASAAVQRSNNKHRIHQKSRNNHNSKLLPLRQW